MKNDLVISSTGIELLSNTDDGTNSLYINGDEVSSSSWVGSGTYTATVEGHAVTITKIASASGNVVLKYSSDYDFYLDYAYGSSAEVAQKSAGILFGQVDSTSTSTAFTATVSGLEKLEDGTCVMLKNGVVTSASGFTININGLGAKPVYSNMAAESRETTIFNISYTMLFIYDSTRVDGGCWICYRGYDSNSNTIGYQIRSSYSSLPASFAGRRYRLWFTSADGTKFVPANTSTATNNTTARTLNSDPIDPFGVIFYNSTNGNATEGTALPVGTLWTQYPVDLRYSLTGITLTVNKPVYLKCTPQADGSAVMNTVVQALPTSEDGYIYIQLGRAYSSTNFELTLEHPVYHYYNGAVRQWTNAAGTYRSVTAGSGTVSVASETVTNLTSMTLDAGVWVVTGTVGYQSGGTAGTYRCAYLGSTATGSQYGSSQVAGSSVGNTIVDVTTVMKLTESTTIYLNALQGSGSALNVPQTQCYIKAVRVI